MKDCRPGEVIVVRGSQRRFTDGTRIWWRGWYVLWDGDNAEWCYTRHGARRVAGRKLWMMRATGRERRR